MPADYSIIVLPRAFADLNDILDHIVSHSPQNAVTTIDRLWAAMQSLDFLPYRFKVHENRKDTSKRVRSMPVGSFIVYYRVDENKKIVRILTVQHGRRRQPRRFK